MRLRIVNGSSMSAYHIDLGQLEGDLIAVDGIPGHDRFAAASSRSPSRSGWTSSSPFPKAGCLSGARRAGRRAQRGPVSCCLPGRDKLPAFPAWQRRHRRRSTLGLERRLRAARAFGGPQGGPDAYSEFDRIDAGYQWSINNVAWTKDVPPLTVSDGERVELAIVNQTMMPHPMHLHGHSFQVVAIDGHRFAGAVRDTVLVPPRRP